MLDSIANGLDPRMQEKGATGPQSGRLWAPLPGPQTDAYYSEADELFYGGQAGGGKSDLVLGLAVNEHERSLIFRREYKPLSSLIDRSKEIIGSAASFNKNDHVWRFPGGRRVEFGAVQHEDDVENYQGHPRDLLALDELPQFSFRQFKFLTGWLRTRRRGQRVRFVGTGNPPTTAEGEWVLEYWAAWLDPQHPNPAIPGELRWYAVVDGEYVEREDGSPLEWKGETLYPKSRTFVPASVDDNPYYLETGYKSILQGLPEPLRSQLLYGKMTAGLTDHPRQVIPSMWVEAAFARWRASSEDWRTNKRPFIIDPQTGRPAPAALSCVGVDVARGGQDKNVLSKRYGTWYAPLIRIPGEDTPNADPVVEEVMLALTEGGYANIDGIGVGASVYDIVRRSVGVQRARSIISSESAPGPDKTGVLQFPNVRSYAWWHMRELLDPSLPEEERLALPPDSKLKADLCAPRWEHGVRGMMVETKEKIAERLHRSTDDGDAVVYASLTDLIYKPAQYNNGFFYQ